MADSKMKSETPEEARKRLEALAEAEKRGTEAIGEGQLQVTRGGDADDAVTQGKAYAAPADKMVRTNQTAKK